MKPIYSCNDIIYIYIYKLNIKECSFLLYSVNFNLNC